MIDIVVPSLTDSEIINILTGFREDDLDIAIVFSEFLLFKQSEIVYAANIDLKNANLLPGASEDDLEELLGIEGFVKFATISLKKS